jgi:methionyl-tRNA synthetase
MRKVLVTAALPYANGAIHFGHIAGAYLPADIYARFERLANNQVLFLCGSDEYGIAIELSAESSKRSPQEHVDYFHQKNKDLFEKMAISFDIYARTTWPGHVETTHQYFQDLVQNGYIDERETEQLYSEQEGRFLADRYVVGTCPKCGYENARGDECTRCAASFEATDLLKPRSKLTDAPLTLRKTKHWYLRLDLLKDKLLEWLEKKEWKPNVLHFIKSYIQDLRPRAITRDTKWGVPLPLPNTEGKVLYVWFDAPIGYISAAKEWAIRRKEPESWKDFWLDLNTKLVQFIGKDNIPFHAAIFPAMTMGQNIPYKLVDELPANEFYELEGKKFSKSDGWYIDLEQFLERYNHEVLRYTIASNAPETADSAFTWKDFQHKCNADLVGKLGNFVHRTLVFLRSSHGGIVPEKESPDEKDEAFFERVHALAKQAQECYQHFKVRAACSTLMELATAGNVYFDSKRPWVLAKSKNSQQEMLRTLYFCLECIKTLAVVFAPLLPEASQKIWQMIGFDGSVYDYGWQKALDLPLHAGKELQEPKLLFTKIEDEQIQKEIDTLMSSTAQEDAQTKQEAYVTFEDVKKLQFKIAEVLKAERVPKSKKLLRLEITTGTDERVIVAGIGHQFTPEQMVGKKIVCLVNLAPATLMGVESQGMMLVASSGDTLELLGCDHIPVGSEVR